MLVAWMAYSVVFGGCVCAVALAADRIAATWNRGRRAIWIVAVGVTAVAPALIALRPHDAERIPPAGASQTTNAAIDITLPVFGHAQSPGELVMVRARRLVTVTETYVAPVWIVATLAWVLLFLRGAISLARQRTHWRSMELDGASVLVAPNVGPAVVGVLGPRVVIPEWALSLDASARALMLKHEAEHIRARDPLLLVTGALMPALFPWNAALWYLARRLRLAIEIDCDRRVLGASALEREYGLLLLTVGARQSAPLPLATSLAERRPFLERRITAMTVTTSRHPRLISAACLGLAVVATTAAVRAPHPPSLVVRAAGPVSQPSTPIVAPTPAATSVDKRTVEKPAAVPAMKNPVVERRKAPAPIRRNPDSLSVAEIREMIQAHHPGVLEG
ncbi:MAG: M56 family metallopeptidase, partial [Gemmatimonadaceae bacterium]